MASYLRVASGLALCLALPAVQADSRWGTTPFQDSHYSGPASVPGKVQLAYFDNGGAEKAYHSYANYNQGSCALNPCDGQYKNMFRKDDGASTSYTKFGDAGWPGDRFASNNSHVPVDQMYWGWLNVSDWVRVSVDIKYRGAYKGSVFATCNSGGEVTMTLDYEDATLPSQKIVFEVPSTAPPGGQGYHMWALNKNIFRMTLPAAGPAVLTVNITGIVGPPLTGQFGNLMWMDFAPNDEDLVV